MYNAEYVPIRKLKVLDLAWIAPLIILKAIHILVRE